MRLDQIAVQLYTVRQQAANDLRATLRDVSAAGYRAVELAALPPVEPKALRDMLDAEALRPVGSHESLDVLRADRDGVLDRMAVLGCPRVIVPWLPDAERTTVQGTRRLADELGRIAAACAERGLRFGYHNHAFEFEPMDGTTIWSVLTDALPPEVELELDVYWAAYGGRDPVELIREAGDRVRLLHMKDMAAGPERNDAAPGDGILPWTEIIATGTAGSVEWYVVEKDDPTDAIEQVTRGRSYLAGLVETASRA